MPPFTKTALIIGAGPAGLTAAYELLKTTDIKPVVVEAENIVGGISATHNYKGNRIDIGGHRFYSKHASILKWWSDILPFEHSSTSVSDIDQSCLRTTTQSPDSTDEIMLIRPRLSRIYFRKQLFDYPLKPSLATFGKLGATLTAAIALDYAAARLSPIRPEKNLEDFFINRFGRTLYETFFEHYTEKVWGIPCRQISREWGSQRIKGVSVGELLRHAFSKSNKGTVETSLIPRFYYPKFGPGQLWEAVAAKIISLGGEIYTGTTASQIELDGNRIASVNVSVPDGSRTLKPDFVFSSMPLKDLVAALTPSAPTEVADIAGHLVYRDFVMTGILAKTMQQGSVSPQFPDVRLLPDTWIYLQERAVQSGRLQNYNNWSPYMVADKKTAWLGLEFFCNEGDQFWVKNDADIIKLASHELHLMGMVNSSDIIDGTCIRIRKAYPAYWGTYHKLDKVKKYLCGISNLFCIGRNGLHRYNNMDHSMLTAIASVKSISDPNISKESIWEINAEESYGEEK